MRKLVFYISLFVLVLIFMTCILGPFATGMDPNLQAVEIKNQPPSITHVFGTDILGRDIFTRVCIGGRHSLLIAFVCTIITTIIGGVYGGLAALIDKLDKPLLFLLDVLVSVPDILLILTLTLFFAHKDILTICFIISLLGWCKMAKLVRDLLKPLRNSGFVLQSRLFHKNGLFIVLFHLIPNIFPLVLSRSLLSFSAFMFYETFISYLGIGFQPPNASWGTLISNAQTYFASYPYQGFSYCTLLFLTMLAINAIGESIGKGEVGEVHEQHHKDETLPQATEVHLNQSHEETIIGDNNAILSVRNLSVAYNGRLILHNVSFDIEYNEILGVIGESGGGKSTLAKAIAGTLSFFGGELSPSSKMFFGGQEIDLQAQNGPGIWGTHGIAVIPQNSMVAFDPTMRIGEQLKECILLTGKHTNAEALEIAKKSLEEVGVDEPLLRLRQYPHQLSGGIAQRIMIAMAIVLEPRLLVCDESTSALDVINQNRIIDLIKKIARCRNIAVLFISHDMRVIRQLATRIIKIHNGELIDINRVNVPSCIHCNGKKKMSDISSRILLNVYGLTAGYSRKQWILHDISFSLAAGETLGILGESGSGKTTLILALLKCLGVTQLPIHIKDKHVIQGIEALRVQYISQNPFSSLDPLWRINRSLLEAGIKERDFDRCLNEVGLDSSVLSSFPGQLSIGQCQRIAIARAIACVPQLLICDEPTSSMDIDNQKLIINLLMDLIAKNKLASIIISHDPELILKKTHLK